MKKDVEILAPAGSYESLKAAIAAGADAVYIGGSRFGARAYANNLSEEQLLEAIDYVHLHGKKIYLTINTLLKERELRDELYDYLLPYYKQGLDAVIVQDIGVLQFVKEQFPDLPIHASTQMTITNKLGAKFLADLGVERVVTARELHLNEIKEISDRLDVEIESFVHGALCYCYSGQCLYSSLIGGRSGNRGQCAQPCRLPYKLAGEKNSQYVLSLKDICTLECIPELVESGIYSFKIEGRMKKPEYVALVTAMYRKYVDLYFKHGKKAFRVDPKDRQMLMDLYNRGGSHTGYYKTRNGKDMVSLDRPNHAGVPALKIVRQNGKQITVKTLVDIHAGDVIEMPDGKETFTFANKIPAGQNTSFITHKLQKTKKDAVLNRTRNEHLISYIQKEIIGAKTKEKIKGELLISSEKPAKLRIMYQDICVEVEGDAAQEALNQPMDQARIEKQMRKTGNTEFEFDTLDITLMGNIFMPMQSLNELRRNGLEQLEKEILAAYRREERELISQQEEYDASSDKMKLHAYIEKLEQLEAVLKNSAISRVYIDCNAIENVWMNSKMEKILGDIHQAGKEAYLGMPHIFRKDAIQKYQESYEYMFENTWDGMLIRNYESYEFLREHGYAGHIVMDYNMYQFNRSAKEFWKREKAETLTAPIELNYRELKEVGLEKSELIVYGYLPMMVSAQCVQKTTDGCYKKKGQLQLIDRYQKAFSVKNNCDYCYNMIYNTSPLVLTNQKEEIQELHPNALRLHFTIEEPKQVKTVLDMYETVFCHNGAAIEPDMEFTRGHFKRGIK